MRVRVKGNQTHVPNLRHFNITEHVAGKIVILESAVTELNHLPGDLPFEISEEKEVYRANRGKRHTSDNGAGNAIVQEPIAHPSAIPEFLSHRTFLDG